MYLMKFSKNEVSLEFKEVSGIWGSVLGVELSCLEFMKAFFEKIWKAQNTLKHIVFNGFIEFGKLQ